MLVVLSQGDVETAMGINCLEQQRLLKDGHSPKYHTKELSVGFEV